jgi:hypothetical protein
MPCQKQGGVVSYLYRGRTFEGGELIEQMIRHGEASPGARGMAVEDALDQIAEANAIGRDSHGDSYVFPVRQGNA